MIETHSLRNFASALALAAVLVTPAAARAAVTISTTNGIGADTYLSNDGQGNQGPTSTHGLESGFQHRVYSLTRMKFLYVRFDKGTNLINYAGSTISINFSGANRSRVCSVYGLKNGDEGEAWGESTVCYSNAPGVLFTNGTPLAQFPTLDTNRMTLLGTMPNFTTVIATNGPQTSAPNTLNLQSFLEADTDGLVTFLFLTTSDNSQSYFGYTKESTNASGVLLGFEPTLNLPNAVVDPGLSNLVWATGSGVWDFSAANWNNGSANAAYQEVSTIGNRVLLDDTASGASPITITLDTPVTPRSVTNNSTKNYIVTGAGSGGINGGTGLTKQGTGTLTLSNVVNGFQGPVRIYDGTLAFGSGALGGTTSSIHVDGGTLKYVGANSDDLSTRVFTFGPAGATIDTDGNTVSWSAAVGGSTTGGLTKAGAGYLSLAGLAHAYTGPTVVSGGALALSVGVTLASPSIVINSGATLDVTGVGTYTLNGAVQQQLSGSGTNLGALTVAAGTSLLPVTSAGTLTIAGDLTMDGGTNVFDVSTNAAGRDLLVVQGNITVNSGRVRLVPGTELTNGLYRLITYTGVLSGSASTMLVDGFLQPGQVALLDDSTSGQINLLVATASSDNIVWKGDGAANLWNVAGAFNWDNAGSADTFNHGDTVLFNSVGAANNTVNLSQAVIPGSVTVDAAADYTFADSTGMGGGKISGGTGLTKNNSGKLTVLTVNNNSGTTVINGGAVQVGNGSNDGHLGSGAVENKGALIFNQLASRTVNGITGTGSLEQLGTTTLTVPGNVSYSGATTIGAGATLVLGNGGPLTLTTSSVTNEGLLVVDTSASQILSVPFTGAGGFTKRGSGALAVNAKPGYAGDTAIVGGQTTLGAANVIPSGLRIETGATVDMNGFNQTVTSLVSTNFAGGTLVNGGANVTNTLVVDNAVDSDSSIAINNGTSGAIALHKKGAGTLILRGNSTFSGGTIVEAGTLDYRADAALGTGVMELSNGVTFNVGGNGVYPGINVLVSPGATANINSAALGNGMGGTFTSGSSSSMLNIVGPLSWGTANVKQFQPFTGTVLIDAAGTLRFSSTGLSVNGGDETTFEVNGILQTRNGTGATVGSGVAVGALTGIGSLGGPQAGTGNSTWIIGAKNLNSVFTGTIYGDVAGSANTIVKTGTGTQTLAGLNYYAGSTIVSNGVLAFSGVDAMPTNTSGVNATAPGILDLSGLPGGLLVLGQTTNNQTVSGDGTINGSVVVDVSGGNIVTVNPGNSTGILTITNGLTLAASSVVNLELNRTSTPASDQIVSPSVVPNGATLNVTNIGPVLIAGQTFRLFNAGVTGFGSVNLPAADVTGVIAYTWQNNLASDGTITLLTGGTANPTNITVVVTGTTLDLNWPAEYTGWELQVQTNSLSVGLSSNWSAVAGSTLTNRVIVPIVPANPTVFYRLRTPAL